MRQFILITFALTFCIIAIGQSDIYKEEFEFSYLQKKNGGQFVYNGKSHSFTIDVISDKIKTTEYPNFVEVDNHILQSSIVPLPASNLDLTKLNISQQKETLKDYVDYELDYFKTDLKLDFVNLKNEWVTVNSKIWLVWTFDMVNQKDTSTNSQKTKSQFYASTICFNQVLDLNMPILLNEGFTASKQIIDATMKGLKLYDKRQE